MKGPYYLNEISEDKFPRLLGMRVTSVESSEIRAKMKVTKSHLAPKNYLHAGSVVSLADTSCGNGCIVNLPENA